MMQIDTDHGVITPEYFGRKVITTKLVRDRRVARRMARRERTRFTVIRRGRKAYLVDVLADCYTFPVGTLPSENYSIYYN